MLQRQQQSSFGNRIISFILLPMQQQPNFTLTFTRSHTHSHIHKAVFSHSLDIKQLEQTKCIQYSFNDIHAHIETLSLTWHQTTRTNTESGFLTQSLSSKHSQHNTVFPHSLHIHSISKNRTDKTTYPTFNTTSHKFSHCSVSWGYGNANISTTHNRVLGKAEQRGTRNKSQLQNNETYAQPHAQPHAQRYAQLHLTQRNTRTSRTRNSYQILTLLYLPAMADNQKQTGSPRKSTNSIPGNIQHEQSKHIDNRNIHTNTEPQTVELGTSYR